MQTIKSYMDKLNCEMFQYLTGTKNLQQPESQSAIATASLYRPQERTRSHRGCKDRPSSRVLPRVREIRAARWGERGSTRFSLSLSLIMRCSFLSIYLSLALGAWRVGGINRQLRFPIRSSRPFFRSSSFSLFFLGYFFLYRRCGGTSDLVDKFSWLIDF